MERSDAAWSRKPGARGEKSTRSGDFFIDYRQLFILGVLYARLKLGKLKMFFLDNANFAEYNYICIGLPPWLIVNHHYTTSLAT